MPTKNKSNEAILYLMGFTILVVFIYAVREILLPFALGIFIAYVFFPIAKKIKKYVYSASLSSFLTLCLLAILGFGFLLLFVPLIKVQIVFLIDALPKYTVLLQERITEITKDFPTLNAGWQDWQNNLQDKLSQTSVWEQVTNVLRNEVLPFLLNLFSQTLSVLNFFLLIFVTPIVVYYMLRDWDSFLEQINNVLPTSKAKEIKAFAVAVDDIVAKFLRGQFTVALIMAIFYSLCLWAIGLEFGIIIGLITGFLTFIPYVGSIVGLLLSGGFALLQFSDWLPIIMVFGVFVVGQMLEGYVFVPRFVGKSVGLNEVWVIFSLMAGGTVLGFLGVLLAVPLAAVIKTFLIHFVLNRKI